MCMLIIFLGSPCSRDAKIGVSSPEKYDDKVDSGGSKAFMMRRPEYLVSCCGVITEWQVYIQKPGTIWFQIWRALGTGEYELVGQNPATYHKGEEDHVFILSVATADQVSVIEGDFIGWYNEDDSMVSYKKEKSGLGALTKSISKVLEVGQVVDWSSTKSSDPKSYAIRATVSKSDKPKFQNLDSGVSLIDNISPGQVIYKLALNGYGDVIIPSTFSISFDTFSEYFSYNQSTNAVTVTQVPPSGKYPLDFTVKDQCGGKDSGTLKVEVKTKLPTILNLPAAVSVREDAQNEEQLLIDIDVVHTKPVTCELKDVSLSSGRHFFLVRNVNGSTSEVYLKSSARLDYDKADSYELTIKCSAGKSSDTGSLFVNVEQNKSPQFTNLPSTVLIHADMNIIGGAIFYVTSEDEENDPINYNMSCDPEPCPFNITRGGSIVVVDDLRTAVSNIFYLEISLVDEYNEAGPGLLIVNITGLNRPPFIYNLPDKATVTLEEHAPPMTLVFQVLAVDQDVNDTLTYSISKAKPTNMIPLFTINETTGEIFAVTSFNYEGMKSKNIRLYPAVSDETTSYQGYLKVSIIDINEAPQFQYNNYTVYTGENKKGFPVAKSLVKATDLDKNDAITYGLNCGTDTPLFSINTKNAEIKQEYELDVDKLGVEEREINCEVTATDKFEMISRASLRFIVSDDNDNTPLFRRTSYLFLVTRDMPLFSIIGQAFATDLDSAPINKRLYYNINEETEDLAIDDNGTIYLTKDLMTVSVGTLFKHTISVEDSKRGKDTVSLTVVVLAGDFTTLVSSLLVEELTFFSLPENMTWFVTAIHLGIILLFLMGYICSRVFSCTLKSWSSRPDDVISTTTNAKSFEEYMWNNLDKTGTRRPSMVSEAFGNNDTVYTSQKKFRSMSLTPVLEMSGNRVSAASTDQHGKWGTETGGKRRTDSAAIPKPDFRRGSLLSTKSSAELPKVPSHVSLSEIEAVTLDTTVRSPWKPWAISDFQSSPPHSFESDNEVVGTGSAAGSRRPSMQKDTNLNF